jgi:hypothetical protein
MKRHLFSCIAAATLLLACAAPGPGDLKPGASVDEVKAQLGRETASYPLPDGGKRLEFSGRGARTYMVDIDASGRMIQWVQVLNETNFRNIMPGMTRVQVLMTLGQPSNVAPGGRQGGEVWSYNFQNTQCLWFQVAIGADGRTTTGGSTALLPACMNAPS